MRRRRARCSAAGWDTGAGQLREDFHKALTGSLSDWNKERVLRAGQT
jgi:hypothetical protein